MRVMGRAGGAPARTKVKSAVWMSPFGLRNLFEFNE
jgi:hypothetical protein